MAEFTNASWNNGWSKSVEKFNTLIANGRTVVNRTFFQRDSMLFIEYSFDSGDFIVLPMSVVERLGIPTA